MHKSDLQVSKERLGPELGSLTGQNTPPEPWAGMQVSAEQTERGSQGSQKAAGSPGLGLSSTVPDSESCELSDLGPENSSVQFSSRKRSMGVSGSLSGADSHHI